MKPQATTPRSPLLALYAALVFAFIYLPIVVLILYSFNRDGVGGFPPRHLTLNWYAQLLADSSIWHSPSVSSQRSPSTAPVFPAKHCFAALSYSL